MIRLGIVGTNYGRNVLLPAFRIDPRCEVIALAGSDEARTAKTAREADVPKAFGDWRALVEDKEVDAIAIATPPSIQAEIALRALALGKAVFAEKPMAGTLDEAHAMLRHAGLAKVPTMIDFTFHQIASWQRAKALLDGGALGRLRHAAVHWHTENRATQMRLRNWKTMSGVNGGGVLGNFISHCFHYVEWFCGPIARMSAHLSGLPDDETLQTTAILAMELQSGASAGISMSCASFLGSGHRIELYGEDGTLMLVNTTTDYMRGFEVLLARRASGALDRIVVNDADAAQHADGRIAPVSRLARQFIDAIENGGGAQPDFAAGYRVQQLIDAAQRAHRQGIMVDVAPVDSPLEKRA